MARGAVDSNLPLASFTAYICIRYGNKENNNNNDHDDDNKMMVMMTDAIYCWETIHFGTSICLQLKTIFIIFVKLVLGCFNQLENIVKVSHI